MMVLSNSINGMKVRDANDKGKLNPGIYIINGKKVLENKLVDNKTTSKVSITWCYGLSCYVRKVF